MRKFCLLSILFLLNGCAESVAFLGSSVGGASSGKMFQSSLNSAISYGIKKQTGKTPLEHAIAFVEEKNPMRKKETCISSFEITKLLDQHQRSRCLSHFTQSPRCYVKWCVLYRHTNREHGRLTIL